jgi:hypothetical protein
METALTMRNESASKTEELDFRDWLRETAEKLKRGDLPPERWEIHHPLEETAAQRRIAALISRIAVKDGRGTSAPVSRRGLARRGRRSP